MKATKANSSQNHDVRQRAGQQETQEGKARAEKQGGGGGEQGQPSPVGCPIFGKILEL